MIKEQAFETEELVGIFWPEHVFRAVKGDAPPPHLLHWVPVRGKQTRGVVLRPEEGEPFGCIRLFNRSRCAAQQVSLLDTSDAEVRQGQLDDTYAMAVQASVVETVHDGKGCPSSSGGGGAASSSGPELHTVQLKRVANFEEPGGPEQPKKRAVKGAKAKLADAIPVDSDSESGPDFGKLASGFIALRGKAKAAAKAKAKADPDVKVRRSVKVEGGGKPARKPREKAKAKAIGAVQTLVDQADKLLTEAHSKTGFVNVKTALKETTACCSKLEKKLAPGVVASLTCGDDVDGMELVAKVRQQAKRLENLRPVLLAYQDKGKDASKLRTALDNFVPHPDWCRMELLQRLLDDELSTDQFAFLAWRLDATAKEHPADMGMACNVRLTDLQEGLQMQRKCILHAVHAALRQNKSRTTFCDLLRHLSGTTIEDPTTLVCSLASE